MNDQALQERLDIFTPEYREFLASDFVEETTTAVARAENLNGVQLRLFQDAIGLYLLCFLDLEETITFISNQAQLTTELTRGMVGAVLSTLPDEIVTGLDVVFTALNGSEETASTSPTNNNPVSPVRTMADDAAEAQAEPTYSSSQDELLKPPIPAPPNPNQPPQG